MAYETEVIALKTKGEAKVLADNLLKYAHNSKLKRKVQITPTTKELRSLGYKWAVIISARR